MDAKNFETTLFSDRTRSPSIISSHPIFGRGRGKTNGLLTVLLNMGSYEYFP